MTEVFTCLLNSGVPCQKANNQTQTPNSYKHTYRKSYSSHLYWKKKKNVINAVNTFWQQTITIDNKQWKSCCTEKK